MRWLADFLYLLAGVAYLPLVLYNAVILGKNRRGWRQRLGLVPRFAPHRRRIWIHAVSLGEINATPQLAAILRERLPHSEIVFSTTTDTGYARAVQLYGRARVFRFPLDFSLIVSRVLGRINPALIVLVELEVWYNLVAAASARGVPVAVVNGRMTERSARRLGWFGKLTRPMFSRLAWVGAQDQATAARFRKLGVPADRVEVTSSLKWDSATTADRVDGDEALARALGIPDDGSGALWVCGSTGPGEEAILLKAYRRLLADRSQEPRTLLVLVPRKPERFEEVASLIQQAGFTCVRRSQRPDGVAGDPCEDTAVVLGDTMGELRKFYALANVVFVGRTLVPLGGSDPMEVAALGKPIVVGPHTENFSLPVRALREANAIRVLESADSLVETIRSILDDPSLAQSLGSRARETVIRNRGATGRTADRLVRLLEPTIRPGVSDNSGGSHQARREATTA